MFKLLNDVNIFTPESVNDDIAVVLSEIILLHDKSMTPFDDNTSIIYIFDIEIIIILN